LLDCLDLLNCSWDVSQSSFVNQDNDPCLDFINKCLNLYPSNRWNIEKLFNHDWIKFVRSEKDQSSYHDISNPNLNENIDTFHIYDELNWSDWYMLYRLYYKVTLEDLICIEDICQDEYEKHLYFDLTKVREWIHEHNLSIFEEIIEEEVYPYRI
jgi:serine/threonine protein kinase